METFTTPPTESQTAFFAEHDGSVHKATSIKKEYGIFLFKTHVLFKRKKDALKIVEDYATIDEVFEGEKKETSSSKFFGLMGNLSNVLGVVQAIPGVIGALPFIFKLVLLILGFSSVTGVGTFLGKKVEEGNTQQVKQRFEKLLKRDPASIGKKYGIEMGKYKDLRGYTLVVYDVHEDKKNRQVWIYNYDQYGKYFCDSLESFHQVLDYKYAGKRMVQQYYTKIKDVE